MYLINVLSTTLDNILYLYSMVNISSYIYIYLLHGHRNAIKLGKRTLYVDAEGEELGTEGVSDLPCIATRLMSNRAKVTFYISWLYMKHNFYHCALIRPFLKRDPSLVPRRMLSLPLTYSQKQPVSLHLILLSPALLSVILHSSAKLTSLVANWTMSPPH